MAFGQSHHYWHFTRLLHKIQNSSGQLDDSRPGNGVEVTGKSIREAVDLLIDGKQMRESDMKPSIGCSIKWIPGNEPDFAK